uniref:Uncharacterized protein n=1 Tax=Anopheles minimus TaxID=112268 RepID=A0A182WP45_9DIPT
MRKRDSGGQCDGDGEAKKRKQPNKNMNSYFICNFQSWKIGVKYRIEQCCDKGGQLSPCIRATLARPAKVEP